MLQEGGGIVKGSRVYVMKWILYEVANEGLNNLCFLHVINDAITVINLGKRRAGFYISGLQLFLSIFPIREGSFFNRICCP